jgi:hypothetical protein
MYNGSQLGEGMSIVPVLMEVLDTIDKRQSLFA